MAYPNLPDTMKAALRAMFISLSAYTKKSDLKQLDDGP